MQKMQIKRDNMKNLRNLVEAILAGNSSKIQEEFSLAMGQKVHSAIDSLREDVLDAMFPTDEEYFIVDFESLDEGAGNLSGLSNHLIKALTKSAGAGENSEVESSGRIKNVSTLKQHIHKALEDGHVPIVHVDGKPVKAAVSSGNGYGARTEYDVHSTDSQDMRREARKSKPYRAGGKMVYPPTHYYDSPHHGKGEAIDSLIHSATKGEADAFKNKNIEIKVVKRDKMRTKKHAERVSNAPKMQTNYVNKTAAEKEKGSHFDGDRKVVSKTSAGDELDGIKNSASTKLAGKKLAGKTAPNVDAERLHAEIGKHLASGNVKGAKQAIADLSNHIQQHGLTTNADKIKDYADNLKKLKGSWSRDYAKQRLADLRNESEDDQSIEEDLQRLIDQIAEFS